MRTQQIKPLTGLRIFAALWVVVYHIGRHNHGVLERRLPDLWHWLRPLVGHGDLGVDLFFVLSGFVLTLNYLDVLGGRFRWAGTGRFLWLRIARVWPVYMLLTLAAGFMIALTGLGNPKVSAIALFKQVLMIQLWFSPEVKNTSWDDPAWSISAEWLAYLLFPLLALVVFRLRETTRARYVFMLSFLALSPVLLIVLQRDDFGGGYTWLARIVCEFTAGALLCAAISRLELTEKQRRWAGWLAIGLAVTLIVFMLVTDWYFRRAYGNYAPALFLPLVGALAVGSGPLHDLLSLPALVLGGEISYSVYLLHGPALRYLRAGLKGIDSLGEVDRLVIQFVFIGVIVGLAYLLYRWVETPARRTMRSMLEHDFRAPDHALVPPEGRNVERDRPLDPDRPSGSVIPPS